MFRLAVFRVVKNIENYIVAFIQPVNKVFLSEVLLLNLPFIVFFKVCNKQSRFVSSRYLF